MSLTTESAVMGAEHLIKNPIGNWQQIYGFRYRLDQIHQIGQVNSANVPDAFLQPGSNPQQQALLFGYQISRTDSNNPVNPTKGFNKTIKFSWVQNRLFLMPIWPLRMQTGILFIL